MKLLFNQGVVFSVHHFCLDTFYLQSIKTSEQLILPAVVAGSFRARNEQNIAETGVPKSPALDARGFFSAKIRFANQGYRDKGSADEKGSY